MSKKSLYTLWSLCAAFACIVNAGPSAAQSVSAENNDSPSVQDSTLHLDWKDTGLTVEDNYYRYCFDSGHAGILLADTAVGAVAYNWVTGTRSVLNSQPFSVCASNGQLYADGPSRVFSVDDPAGRLIERMPTHFAQDGSAQVYWFQTPAYPNTTGTLLASSDGGLNWRSIGDKFKGQIAGFAMASADAQAIYVLAKENVEAGEPFTDGLTGQTMVPDTTTYRVYFSGDAGHTWSSRGTLDTFNGESQRSFLVDFATMPGANSSIDLLTATIYVRTGHSNGGASNLTFLSGNGGATFDCAICYNAMESTPYVIYSTQEGLLRLDRSRDVAGQGNNSLALSIDSGQHWLPLSVPTSDQNFSVEVNERYPFIVYLNRDTISLDGGHTWQVSDSGYLQFLPYWPLRAYQLRDGRLLLADVPGSEKIIRARVAPNYAPGGTYSFETGHNLWGAFRQYWYEHDGQNSLGYPVSEPVPAESSEEGRVYITQRFEKATLELHYGNGVMEDQIVVVKSGESYSQSAYRAEP